MAIEHDAGTPAAKPHAVEQHGMKPVAVVFAAANAAVLAVFGGLLASGWIEFGISAAQATGTG